MEAIAGDSEPKITKEMQRECKAVAVILFLNETKKLFC